MELDVLTLCSSRVHFSTYLTRVYLQFSISMKNPKWVWPKLLPWQMIQLTIVMFVDNQTGEIFNADLLFDGIVNTL
jgi:hypothetical protein